MQGQSLESLTGYLLVAIQGLITFGQCRRDHALLLEVVACVMRSLRNA